MSHLIQGSIKPPVSASFDVGERRNLPLGIYFSLPEQEYFNDIGLGSNDTARLSYSPQDFYWESKFNPLWEPSKDTPAIIYGRAAHKICLEGREELEKHFAPKRENWSTKAGHIERDEFALSGKTPVPAESWDRLLLTGAMIRANPYLADALSGGVGSEVSVFWENNGIKKKARIDRLKEFANIDLKNVSNERSISFPQACLRKIDENNWHIQAAHYLDARRAMAGLLAEGSVYGPHNPARLAKVCASKSISWVWTFVQSTGAPLTWSTKLTYEAEHEWIDPETGEVQVRPEEMNPILKIGFDRIRRADENYKKCMARFGPDTPWLLAEPINELQVEDLPFWFLRNNEHPAI